MSEEQTTPFKYVAVTLSETDHRVFLVHNSTPEWWRAVAAFKNRKRAEVYAEVENFCVEDRAPGEVAAGDESPAPPGLPAEPPSSLTVLLTPTARPQIVAPEPKPEPPAPQLLGNSEQLPNPVPGPGDDILEAAAQEALAHLPTVEVHETEAAEAGHVKIAAAIPDEIVPPSHAKRQTKAWADAELTDLHGLCKSGTALEGLAKRFGRTAGAVEQQIIYRGWSNEWRAAKATAREAPKQAEPPVPVPPTEEPETTDLDDLNYAQKAVLKAIMSLPHDSNDKAVAEWADLDAGRIPGIVRRLVDLGCLGEIGGFTTLTDLGRTLVGQIKIARAVRILTPVVRRVPEKPPVPEARPARESHNGHANHAAKPPGDDRIDAVTYLERKGAAVSRLGNGQFIVNGERRSAADVVHLINSHRRMAELPAIDESQIC